jgi:hypothetical protein
VRELPQQEDGARASKTNGLTNMPRSVSTGKGDDSHGMPQVWFGLEDGDRKRLSELPALQQNPASPSQKGWSLG